MKPTPAELDTLRALECSGAVTVKELQKEFPDVIPVHLDRFFNDGLALKEVVPNRPSIWSITPKGRRVATASEAYVGEIPTPKYRPPHQNYKPAAVVVTRPGALDAFQLPSRTGAKLTPHRLPISLSAQGDSLATNEQEE